MEHLMPKDVSKRKEFAGSIRASLLLGLPNKNLQRNPDYIRQLPHIKELYQQAAQWHGTGRFQYEPPAYENIRDVVDGIIKNGALVPHKDPLDYSRGLMYSVSASPSRLYSSLYAQLHYEKGRKIRNTFVTGYGWAVFMNAIGMAAIRSDRQLLNKQFRRENGLSDEGTAYFHQKYTKSKIKPKHMIQGGQSDIRGNYPMLIGIQEDAFPKEDIAVVLRKHESRSTVPIGIDKFTHFEVPLPYVAEVGNIFSAANINIPVIPMEYGEEYSKTLPISWIVDGKPT